MKDIYKADEISVMPDLKLNKGFSHSDQYGPQRLFRHHLFAGRRTLLFRAGWPPGSRQPWQIIDTSRQKLHHQ